MKAIRQLGDSTSQLSTSYQRLSSGQRINTASDDAAGLAVSTQLQSQASIGTVAVRNLNDGISALNIADSALASQSSIIERLQELAQQSANGVFSDNQRTALNNEYLALVQEFGRIGNTTSFNDINLLQGGRGSNLTQLMLQAGFSGATTSGIGITLSDTGSFSGTIQYNTPSAGFAVGVPATIDQIAAAYNNVVLRTEVTDSAGVRHKVLVGIAPSLFNNLSFTVFGEADESDGTVSSDPTKYINLGNTSTGFNATSGDISNNGQVSIALTHFTGGVGGTLNLDLSGLQIRSSGISANINTNVSSIESTGVETQTQAQASMAILQTRATELTSIRGTIGATQSRLNVASAAATTMRDNFSAAASRITDTDIASESAILVATQIKQQAATAVLAQANQQPTLLISLLQN